jgi:hypothetical protein
VCITPSPDQDTVTGTSPDAYRNRFRSASNRQSNDVSDNCCSTSSRSVPTSNDRSTFDGHVRPALSASDVHVFVIAIAPGTPRATASASTSVTICPAFQPDVGSEPSTCRRHEPSVRVRNVGVGVSVSFTLSMNPAPFGPSSA